MTRSIIILIIAVLTVAPVVQAEVSQADEARIKAEIMQVHDNMKAAAVAGNVDALYAHVSEKLNEAIIEDGELYKNREEAMASSRRGFKRTADLEYNYTHQKITVLCPTLVLWVADGSASATRKNGSTRSAPFAETIVFTLEDGKWKVLHAHRSAPDPRR